MDAEFWNTRYRESHRIWSAQPNPQLVAEVSDLPPGAALDAGCGEGADAVWLARRGWAVTAVDFAQAALDKGIEEAANQGLDITWRCQDLVTWRPPREFDLVSAQFFHLEPALRDTALVNLADAVAPGGTLLVVGHHHRDLVTPTGHERHAPMLFGPDEIVALLDADWQIVVSEARPREIITPDGGPFTHTDTVVRALRTSLASG